MVSNIEKKIYSKMIWVTPDIIGLLRGSLSREGIVKESTL